MRKIVKYLNPIARFGQRNYSFLFPLITAVVVCLLLEGYAFFILHDPTEVSMLAIILFVILVIYFSFRDAVRGGLIVTAVAIIYYFYLVESRNYSGNQLESAIEAILGLAILYLLLSGVIGSLRQRIDELIEREADEKKRLQSIIQQLPVGVIITDKNGQITEANKQADVILGREIRIGDLIRSDKSVRLKNKTAPQSAFPIFQSLTTGRAITGKEFTIHQPNGKVRYISVNSNLIHTRSGKILAVASIITDLTDRKEMEQRKDDFVNMASHELKTPITSLKLYIDTLMKHEERTNDDRAIRIIKSIHFQTERLQALVSDLLDVSRIQTGKLTFTKEVFDLDGLVTDTTDALAGTSRHTIRFKNTNKSAMVYADRFRIYQVLTNLITNAIKYSPDDKDIIVTLKKEKDKATVCVKDSGIGIAKDNQKKIFDRLYQVTDPKEKTFPGLGMGLYISKEIITRHRGAIWVESEKGKGSAFFFSLPLKKKTKRR